MLTSDGWTGLEKVWSQPFPQTFIKSKLGETSNPPPWPCSNPLASPFISSLVPHSFGVWLWRPADCWYPWWGLAFSFFTVFPIADVQHALHTSDMKAPCQPSTLRELKAKTALRFWRETGPHPNTIKHRQKMEKEIRSQILWWCKLALLCTLQWNDKKLYQPEDLIHVGSNSHA